MLENGSAWVEWIFCDGSRRSIHTTLDTNILEKFGVTAKENFLYDLEHREYVPFRKDVAEVNVLAEKPENRKEVLKFANGAFWCCPPISLVSEA